MISFFDGCLGSPGIFAKFSPAFPKLLATAADGSPTAPFPVPYIFFSHYLFMSPTPSLSFFLFFFFVSYNTSPTSKSIKFVSGVLGFLVIYSFAAIASSKLLHPATKWQSPAYLILNQNNNIKK